MKRKGLIVSMALYTAACLIAGCSNTSDSGTSLFPVSGKEKPLVLANFQEASLVLGQPDFTTGAATTAAGNTFAKDSWVQAAVVQNKLFIPDGVWNRIMVYDDLPSANNQDASALLAQLDYISTSANRGVGASQYMTLKGPQTIDSYGEHVVITDFGNNRLLIYNDIPESYNAAADVVVGQPDFSTTDAGNAAATADTIYRPESAVFADGKLIVTDAGNSRILIYNRIPSENGASADLVLGQGDFTHNIDNDDNQDGAQDANPTARTLGYPEGVWSDGKKLIVADETNHRILIWNTFPKFNFQPADVVIGQSSMTTNAFSAGAAGLYDPNFITVYAGQLIVADMFNNRVLIYNRIPSVNGASADIVLGQGDFDHIAGNDDNQDGTTDANPTARTMFKPSGVCVMDGKLIVSDYSNSRQLVFETQ